MVRRRQVALVVVLGLALVGCGRSEPQAAAPSTSPASPTAAPPTTAPPPSSGCNALRPTVAPHPDPASLARVQDVLEVVAGVGWNPEAPPRVDGSRRPGGLYVNWRPDWTGSDAAANTNVKTSGQSDAQAGDGARHDPLTDLVVLRDLDAYLATRPAAVPALSRLRCQLQPVVATEFQDYRVFRPWVYGTLADLTRLDPDGGWAERAERAATAVAEQVDPVTGVVTAHRGSYRADYAAQAAAALVDAGRRSGRSAWVTLGGLVAGRLVAAAADPRTGLFPGELRASGSRDTVLDPQVKVGSQAQLLEALLDVYDVTGEAALRDAVGRALPSLAALRLPSGGYAFGADADGSGRREDYVETRSAWVLPLLEHWERLTGTVQGSQSVRDVVRDRLWQPRGGAYVYRLSPQLSEYVGDGGVHETWVSTEAVGIAAQVLLGELS